MRRPERKEFSREAVSMLMFKPVATASGTAVW
jgi:hypothetical protein